MSKEPKTTIIQFEQKHEEDFKDPSKWFIMNALGEYVYFHKRSREDAQKVCDEEYGKGRYKVIASSNDKSGGSISCRGFSNSRSRAGSNYKNILNKQIKGV